MVLALLCVGIFLIQLDVTVVNVALPSLRVDLHTSLAGQQWVVDSYMIALACLLLLCGAAGDRIGHRKVVLAGLSVFGLASLACGLAPTIQLLVLARAVQGVGAALLLPGTLALITSLYSDAAARARAMGLWAGAGALALPSGPLLGGALLSAFGWRAVFLVNLPVIAVALPVGYRLIPAAKGVRGRLRPPITSAFVGSNLVAGLMNLVGLGTVLVVTLYLQERLGHSALRAGLELVPLFVPLAVLGPVAGRVTARYGPRPPMTAGLLLGAAGSACLLLLTPDSGYAAVVPAELGIGVGMGLLTAAVVSAAVGSLPSQYAGLASGVNNTARQAVGAVGIAVYGAVVGGHAAGDEFVRGMHELAWIGAGLWLVALAVTWLTIGSARPDRPEDDRAQPVEAAAARLDQSRGRTEPFGDNSHGDPSAGEGD